MDVGQISALMLAVASVVGALTKYLTDRANERQKALATRQSEHRSEVESAADMLERHAKRLESDYEIERKRRQEAEAERDERVAEVSEKVEALETKVDQMIDLIRGMSSRLDQCPHRDPACPGRVVAAELLALVAEQSRKPARREGG